MLLGLLIAYLSVYDHHLHDLFVICSLSALFGSTPAFADLPFFFHCVHRRITDGIDEIPSVLTALITESRLAADGGNLGTPAPRRR